MAETAQLAEYDETLYKVTTGDNADADNEKDFYLIATSEQPISAFYYKETLQYE